jgi:hypothetical protein
VGATMYRGNHVPCVAGAHVLGGSNAVPCSSTAVQATGAMCALAVPSPNHGAGCPTLPWAFARICTSCTWCTPLDALYPPVGVADRFES